MGKPILFNTEMVKAILEGRKTITRRKINEVGGMNFIGFVSGSTSKEHEGSVAFGEGSFENIVEAKIKEYKRPPYKVGDVLYVRETFFIGDILNEAEDVVEGGVILYKADKKRSDLDYELLKWRPSLHMPKKIARIFLKVTDVRVGRLQDMTRTDAKKEGFEDDDKLNNNGELLTSLGNFARLWDTTMKKDQLKMYGRNANPWVWVIEFEKYEPIGKIE